VTVFFRPSGACPVGCAQKLGLSMSKRRISKRAFERMGCGGAGARRSSGRCWWFSVGVVKYENRTYGWTDEARMRRKDEVEGEERNSSFESSHDSYSYSNFQLYNSNLLPSLVSRRAAHPLRNVCSPFPSLLRALPFVFCNSINKTAGDACDGRREWNKDG